MVLFGPDTLIECGCACTGESRDGDYSGLEYKSILKSSRPLELTLQHEKSRSAIWFAAIGSRDRACQMLLWSCL